MEVIVVGSLLVCFFGMVAVMNAVNRVKGGHVGPASAKFPPTFSSSLSTNEVLSVVEARLKSMQSLRTKWKTTEKVEKVGRLQSMLTVPYNLSGSDIKISFLMNLLATKRDAGGCTVEWNYVMMSPVSYTPAELTVFENEIYKTTTLETRSALFIAQGDMEEAEFLQTQAEPSRKPIEIHAAPEPLRVTVKPADVSQAPKNKTPKAEKLSSSQNESAPKNEKFFVDSLPETPDENNIPANQQPDIVNEISASVSATTDDSTLMQTPELQSISVSGLPNPLNFSPPDPNMSSAAAAPADKCMKCSQARDPNFNFCLYCGHSEG